MHLSLDDLLDYTEWQRQKWQDWLRQHGDAVLKTAAGPHGDGRFESVGEVMRHIFSAEKRYVDRLSGRPLTETASLPCDDAAALFSFGQESRKALREFVQTFPEAKWDVLEEFKMQNTSLTATPRKIIIHVLMHEIRHWAQIATLLRLNGLTIGFHDFLFSPVLGGEFRRDAPSA